MTEQYNFLEAVQKYIVKALQYVFALTGIPTLWKSFSDFLLSILLIVCITAIVIIIIHKTTKPTKEKPAGLTIGTQNVTINVHLKLSESLYQALQKNVSKSGSKYQ